MTVSPLVIKVLLHCYAIREPIPDKQTFSTRSAIDWLSSLEMIEFSGDAWRTTDGGNAWVALILQTPMPRQAWVGQDGVEINADL